MSVLSAQAEHEIALGVLSRMDKLIEERARADPKFDYVLQDEFMKKLKISPTYLKKLRTHGLKVAILDEDDKYKWYSLGAAQALMDSIAE